MVLISYVYGMFSCHSVLCDTVGILFTCAVTYLCQLQLTSLAYPSTSRSCTRPYVTCTGNVEALTSDSYTEGKVSCCAVAICFLTDAACVEPVLLRFEATVFCAQNRLTLHCGFFDYH